MLVHADDDSGLDRKARVRPLVRGRYQLHGMEFTGEHEADREFRHRDDELMHMADGAVEVEADGRGHRLGRGETLLLSGGVWHRCPDHREERPQSRCC